MYLHGWNALDMIQATVRSTCLLLGGLPVATQLDLCYVIALAQILADVLDSENGGADLNFDVTIKQ